MMIDNMDRVGWAATAIEAFTTECRMDGEDDQTKAKDLITNLCHFLRLSVGMTAEEAASVATAAINMFEQEVAEDEDGTDDED
jgi:hypothetical protein